jgi:hypothetical protein
MRLERYSSLEDSSADHRLQDVFKTAGDWGSPRISRQPLLARRVRGDRGAGRTLVVDAMRSIHLAVQMFANPPTFLRAVLTQQFQYSTAILLFGPRARCCPRLRIAFEGVRSAPQQSSCYSDSAPSTRPAKGSALQ